MVSFRQWFGRKPGGAATGPESSSQVAAGRSFQTPSPDEPVAPVAHLMSGKTVEVDDGGDRRAGQAGRQEARLKRLAERAKRTGAGERPVRLCSLETVEVKKRIDGYHVAVTIAEGRRSFFIAPHEVEPVLRDLETAIQVVRGQQ